jgi:hypothetical protein
MASFGLEIAQECECRGAQSVGSYGSALLLARDFVWGDPQRYPEVVAMQTYTLSLPRRRPRRSRCRRSPITICTKCWAA